MSETPILGMTDLNPGQSVPEATVNEHDRILEWFAAGAAIEDRDENDPTAITPGDGQAWLIADSATGAWSGKDGQIALYVNTGFLYFTVKEGMRIWVKDENVKSTFNGSSWEDEAAASQTKAIIVLVTDPNGSALSTGDGAAFVPIPSTVGGKVLSSAKAFVITVSSSGAITVQIHNATAAVDMLSTELTIDEGESDSTTAATPAVIDTDNDDVATDDMLRIDIDGAGTDAKGLIVVMTFQ